MVRDFDSQSILKLTISQLRCMRSSVFQFVISRNMLCLYFLHAENVNLIIFYNAAVGCSTTRELAHQAAVKSSITYTNIPLVHSFHHQQLPPKTSFESDPKHPPPPHSQTIPPPSSTPSSTPQTLSSTIPQTPPNPSPTPDC